MKWLRRFFEPAWWFRWTVAGRAVRDGWAGWPLSEHVREMSIPKGRVDRLAALLNARRAVLQGPVHAEGDGRPPNDGGDYDGVLAELNTAMEARGGSLERLDRAEQARLVDLMSELVHRTDAIGQSASGVKAVDGASAADALTHYEAHAIDLANYEAATVRIGWERVRHKLEAELGRIQHHLRDVTKQHARQHRRHQEKDLRSPHPMIPWWFYIAVMFLMGLLEMPFNLEAFKILEVDPEERWLLALGPSIAILFLAHVSGTKLRQWPDRFSWKHVLVVAIATTALLATLAALGMLRAEYVAALTKQPVNVWQALELIAINLIFLVAGTFAAYAAHDPDRDLERISGEKRQLRKQIDQLWKNWNRVGGEYDTQRGVTAAEIDRIRAYALACIGEYRDMNARARVTASLPESFRLPVDDRFFAPVDLGPELDKAPSALQDMLKIIDEEEGPRTTVPMQAEPPADAVRSSAASGVTEQVRV